MMPSLNRVQVLRYHLQVPLRQAGSDATINDKSNSRMQNNPLIDMSASGSKTWWTVNELYLSYGGIMFLVGVTVARFVYYMQSRRNSTTKNRTICAYSYCICVCCLKDEENLNEKPSQISQDRNNMTLIDSTRYSECSYDNKNGSALSQVSRKNSRVSTNSCVRRFANPRAKSKNKTYGIQKGILHVNSQTALNRELQPFESQNSISLENQDISQHRKETDMDAERLVSEQDSYVQEDSDSQLIAREAVKGRNLSENHEDPVVINFDCTQSNLNTSNLSDQNITHLQGLSEETISNPMEEQRSIINERFNTNEVPNYQNEINLQSLPLDPINYTGENGVTACNHAVQDTTTSGNYQGSSQQNMDAASDRQIDHIEQNSLQHGHHICQYSELDCTNQVCYNFENSIDSMLQPNSAKQIGFADEVTQTFEMSKEKKKSSLSECEIHCVVNHDDGLCNENDCTTKACCHVLLRPNKSTGVYQIEQDCRNNMPAGPSIMEKSGFTDVLSNELTTRIRDSGYETRRPSVNSSGQQLQVVTDSDTSSNQNSDLTALQLAEEAELQLQTSTKIQLKHKTTNRNHQATSDLIPKANNTDCETVCPTDDRINDQVPDSPKAVDDIPDISLTTVDNRNESKPEISLASLTAADALQTFDYYLTASHSRVCQVTEEADNTNVAAKHSAPSKSSFTESELVKIPTQRPRLEIESSTGVGNSIAMLASSTVTAGQLLRDLVAHLPIGVSNINQYCKIQHIMLRLLEATVSNSQDRRVLENLLRSTPLAIDLLTAACYIGFHETIESLLLDNPLFINQQDSTGVTPLAAASGAGNLDTVRWLVHNGADVNMPNSNGRTSLIVAAERVQHDVFSLLTSDADVDLDVDVVDDDWNTAMHYIIEKSNNGGRSILHNVCIDSDAGYVRKIVFASSRNEVNAQDNDGWTPLHLACLMGKQDVVNILMWAGADTDVLDTAGNTPGDLAMLLGYYDIAVTLGHRPYPENVWFPTDFPFFVNMLND